MGDTEVKVYLASSIAYMNELAIPLMKKLRAEGATITHDWTAYAIAEGKLDSELEPETRYKLAHLSLEGVRHADAFWLALPPTGGQGCFVEFGFALREGVQMRRPIFISGPQRTVFQSLVCQDRVFSEHPAALAEILAWGRKEGLL